LVLFLLNGEKMRSLNTPVLALLLSLSTVSCAEESEVENTQVVAKTAVIENIQEVNEVSTETIPTPEVVEVAKPAGPVQTIQTAIVKLNQLTTVANYSPQLIGRLIQTEVAPLFDFGHIASEIALVSNLRLGYEEQAYFVTKIKQNIITSLLSRLTQARSTSFAFISARPIMGGSISVKLKVNGYYSYGMFLDLIFHQTADQSWKIADIVLNNDSLINYYQKMVLIKLRRYGVYGMLGRL
jgi:phospholipid transport system substrate-binding protein